VTLVILSEELPGVASRNNSIKLRLRETEVEVRPDGMDFSPLLFDHEIKGGIIIVIGVILNLLALLLGFLWSFL